MPIVIRELVVKVKVSEPLPAQSERPGKHTEKSMLKREHDLVMEAIEQTMKILHNKKER